MLAITPAWRQDRRRQTPSHFDQCLEQLLCSDPIGEQDRVMTIKT